MHPEIDLGPITLQTFGLMTALAFVAAGLVIRQRLRELGAPGDWAYELVLAGAAGGLLGAKLWYALQQGDWSLEQLFSGSGLVWYGGALGGAAAVCAWAKWRGILNLTMFDMCAPALAVGYAVGRVGCQLSGDGDYGEPTDAWWGMSYENGTVPTPPGVEVHPTPIFETVLMTALAVVLWRLRDRFKPGVLFGVYLIASSVERFFIEYLRRNDAIVGGMTPAQLTSVVLASVGAGLIISLRDRPREPARLTTAD